MKLFFSMVLLVAFSACGDTANNPEEANSTATKEMPKAQGEQVADQNNSEPANIVSTKMGTIHNGYLLHVHELISFVPKVPKPGSIFKPLDANFDYYIVDVSVENPTDVPQDSGGDMLAVYFTVSDGSTVNTGLKSASLLAHYFTDYKRKYPQSDYDKIWSSKFPAHDKARSEVFAVAVPKNTTLTGIGMYQKSKTKNKYVAFYE